MYRSLITVVMVAISVYGSEQIRIINDSINVSSDSLETINVKMFYNRFKNDIIACSPGIENMITASEVRKLKNEYYTNKITHFIGIESHPLITALYIAFEKHKKIIIKPDMIWLLICQGASTHINLNSSKYRYLFTKNLKKQKITVREDSLTMNFQDINWINAIEKISDSLSFLVDSNLFKLYDPQFSTTGLDEKAAFQLTLMNAAKDFYEYNVKTACGIPEIIIEGERSDWVWIYENIDGFNILGLQWWTKIIKPLLNEFINVYDGKINREHWESIFTIKSISGGSLRINGWIKDFFPYVLNKRKKYVKNDYLGIKDSFDLSIENIKNNYKAYEKWSDKGLKVSSFSNGLQVTPFIWIIGNIKYSMLFHSGYLGVKYENDILEPKVGYIIEKK